MLPLMALSAPARAVAEFERVGLANKSLIDATAVDIPLITLANNSTERKERAFRQALVLLLGFLLAPLHSKALSHHFSKNLVTKKLGLADDPTLRNGLFQTSFKNLQSVEKLQAGLEKIFPQGLPEALDGKINETLRKQLLASKSKFLMLDLAVLCTLFSSIGFFKVLFGNKLSGKKQFTGELGAVEQSKLDALYQQQAQNKPTAKNPYAKEMITLGLGAIIPVVLGAALWRGHFQPGSGGLIRKASSLFDYQYPQLPKALKSWPMMSNAGLILSALVLTMGELASARSKREFKSLAIQRNSIDALFFFGTPLFMAIFNKGARSMEKVLERQAATNASPEFIKKAANRSALTFVASFLLNLAAVSGIIVWTNKMTQADVREASSNLTTQTTAPMPSPSVPSTLQWSV